MQFWELIGLDDLGAMAYRTAVEHPRITIAELTKHLGSTTGATERAVAQIASLGLGRCVDGALEINDPRSSLRSQARRHQSELDRAGLIAGELSALYASARLAASPTDLIEPLQAGQIPAKLLDLVTTATTSVCATTTPPFVMGPSPELAAAELACLNRGVSFRTIYHRDALEVPEYFDDIHTMISSGEQARTHPSVRTKMIIVDNSIALLPLARGTVAGEIHAVVVSRSAMTDALLELFESLWSSAAELRLGTQNPTDDEAEQLLLRMFAAGVSDATVCRRLSLSERTLRRRVKALEEKYSVTSRFQLGVLARSRGLV